MNEALVIDNGPRSVPEGMVQDWPPMTEADQRAVMKVFETGELHTRYAPHASELEERWADYCDAEYCIFCNGGTQALHMALAAVGVQPGDEVILPAFSYWSTAASILHQNAIPVFVDIDPITYTIDPTEIESAITNRTKAIVPVHIHGMPADITHIMKIAQRYDLPVVHDACQAHGAKYKDKRMGAYPDATAFSLNRHKNLSGGEGGLITMNEEHIYERVAQTGSPGGISCGPNGGDERFFGLGYNYRPHEFIAAFVLSQLERLEEYNEQRQELARYLTESLEDIPGFAGPETPAGVQPVYFTYVLEFCPEELDENMSLKEFRDRVEPALEAEGVPLGQWQREPLPAMDLFQEKVGYGKGCPWTCKHGREVSYDPTAYPETDEFIARHTYVSGVYPPNSTDLMDCYIQAFTKVSEAVQKGQL